MIVTGQKNETVEIRSVADEIRSLGRVDLMKLNIEGAEYELLGALAEADLMGEVRFIQVQFHDFVPDAVAKLQEARELLSRTHDVMWEYPFVWESWELRSNT